VLYEEKEDEFDIEDTETLLHRTDRAQEQAVDIFTLPDPELEPSSFHITHFKSVAAATLDSGRLPPLPAGEKMVVNTSNSGNGGVVDDDFSWADEDPDDDLVGWKMKVILEEEETNG